MIFIYFMPVPCLRRQTIYLLVIAMEKCYSMSCRVWSVVESWFVVVPCGPSLVVHVSYVDRAFEPVGRRCVRPSRSWVYPAVAVVPSITRSLVFRCLRSAMIESSYLRATGIALCRLVARLWCPMSWFGLWIMPPFIQLLFVP